MSLLALAVRFSHTRLFARWLRLGKIASLAMASCYRRPLRKGGLQEVTYRSGGELKSATTYRLEAMRLFFRFKYVIALSLVLAPW